MNPEEPAKRRVSLDLSDELLAWLDGLKAELGLRSRGAILEHVLAEIRHQAVEDDELSSLIDRRPGDGDGDETADAELDERSAIVLISSEIIPSRDLSWDPLELSESEVMAADRAVGSSVAGRPRRGDEEQQGGIQLPGFVRRQARALGRSLKADIKGPPERSLALISEEQLSDAMQKASQHWREIYGQPPAEPVLEAAMVWLARDVWPQSDHSDGRPFTWSLTQRVVHSFAPSWSIGEASLERVITAAGILEDPFSGSTLSLRVPTLITRFVQRHRSRQKRTMSFEAIDQSMTVHGALRLLQLPTTADRPYTLREIRDAYREQAQNHHPDAGGSADAMRRLNEAYQFLKERYRRAA